MRQKKLVWGTAVACAVVMMALSMGGANAISSVPFRMPLSYHLLESPDITLYARRATGWTPFRLGISSPHAILSSAASLATFLTGGAIPSSVAPTLPGIGPASQELAFGDFLGDGSPGAVYLSYGAPSVVRVAMGTPAYLFRSNTPLAVGPTVGGMIVADFNRDSKLDFAVDYYGNGNQKNGGVAVFLNTGGGVMASPVHYATGTSASSVATLDVNHDNILDLVIPDGSSDPGTVRIYLGTGTGTFTAGQSYPAGPFPTSVTIADLNNDTHPDLALSGANGVVTSLLGSGTGTFQAGSTYQVQTQNSAYIAAGDLNGDGKIDLVTANRNDTVTVARGLGNGSFQIEKTYVSSYNPTSLIITDFNLDGKLDILNGVGTQRALAPSYGSGNMDVLLGNGDLTFDGIPVVPISSGTATFVKAADFNGDGRLDAISNNLFGSRVALMNGLGNGTFAAPVLLDVTNGGSITAPQDAAVADFNGDGRPDMALAESIGGQVSIHLNNGTGGFQGATRFSARGTEPKQIISADFTGDGKLDLAVMSSSFPSGPVRTSNVAVFTGGGNGAFSFQQTYDAGIFPGGIAATDLNQDGRADLIVTDQGNKFATPPVAGSVFVYLSNGAGFNTALKPVIGEHPGRIGASDLNGDGKTDLVFFTEDDSFNFNMVTMLGNGNGTFQPLKKYKTDFNIDNLVVRDFDGDGKPDVIVAHCCGATQPAMYFGKGDGSLSEEVLFNGLTSPTDVAAGDANNDGKLDLLIAGGSQDGVLVALLNHGEGHADIVNSASFSADLTVAPDSIASIFGNHLSAGTALDDASVTVVDSAGQSQTAYLYAVFPTLINFHVPPGLSTGLARVKITSKDGVISSGNVNLATAAPGIYAVNGLANGIVIRDDRPGTFEYTVQNVNGATVSKPVVIGNTGNTFLILYGTGIRGAPQSQVVVKAGTTTLPTGYAGLQGSYPGFDQMNLTIPPSLRGAGDVTITTTVAGKTANAVKLTIQ